MTTDGESATGDESANHGDGTGVADGGPVDAVAHAAQDAVTHAAQDIGTFIRSQRVAAQVSLRQLAERAGVSNPYLSQIERGLRKPSADVLAQIARACACRPRCCTFARESWKSARPARCATH